MAKTPPLISEEPTPETMPPEMGGAEGLDQEAPAAGGEAVGLDLDALVAKVQQAQDEGKTVKIISAQAETNRPAIEAFLEAASIPGLEIITQADPGMEILGEAPETPAPAGAPEPGGEE